MEVGAVAVRGGGCEREPAAAPDAPELGLFGSGAATAEEAQPICGWVKREKWSA